MILKLDVANGNFKVNANLSMKTTPQCNFYAFRFVADVIPVPTYLKARMANSVKEISWNYRN